MDDCAVKSSPNTLTHVLRLGDALNRTWSRNRNMLLTVYSPIRTLGTLLLLLGRLLCEAGDETIRLQEVEGSSITLRTGITGIQRDARILWFYGSEKAEEEILVSLVFKGETVTEIRARFKERLQLNRSSGDLIIRNISRTDSGLYLLQVITGRLSSKTFSVTVYAPVAAPVIRTGRGTGSVFPTEPCSVVCSVENGDAVTLSWYRENERISISSNTDLSVPLNLSLHLQHPENYSNTYSCVSGNPATNKTTSLNITQLFNYSSGESHRSGSLLPVLISGLVFLLFVTSGLVWIRTESKNNKARNLLDEVEEPIHTEVTFTAHTERERNTSESNREGNSGITRDPEQEKRLASETSSFANFKCDDDRNVTRT